MIKMLVLACNQAIKKIVIRDNNNNNNNEPKRTIKYHFNATDCANINLSLNFAKLSFLITQTLMTFFFIVIE